MNLDDVYKFCPRCTNKLNKKRDDFYDCLKCGFHFFINPKATTGLILENDKGQILLVKRKYEPKKNFWDTPGGFVQLKENATQSLQREVKEELGIEINNLIFFATYWSYYPYQGIPYQTLYLVYTAKYKGEKITVADDVLEYKFFVKKNFPFEKIAFADVKEGLQDYLKKFP